MIGAYQLRVSKSLETKEALTSMSVNWFCSWFYLGLAGLVANFLV